MDLIKNSAIFKDAADNDPIRGPTITWADTAFPEGAAQCHTLITGSKGSGKTNALKGLLKQLRAQGEKALVIDPKGDLFESFYEPSKDFLLNPYDARSVRWSVFEENKHTWRYDMIAERLLPLSPQSEPWCITPARILLAAGLRALKSKAKGHHDPHRMLFQTLIDLPQEQMYETLGKTWDTMLLRPFQEQHIQEIRKFLEPALKALLLCDHPSKDAFSVKDWVKKSDESKEDWLWITKPSEQEADLGSMVSTWFSTALSALSDLPTHPRPRLWIIMDDLTKLGKLPSLMDALSISRRYGGCLVLSAQDRAHIHRLYDQDLYNINTRIMFHQPTISGPKESWDGLPQDLTGFGVGEALVKIQALPLVRVQFKEYVPETQHPRFTPRSDGETL